ncbi:MAG: thiamine pyrophosphate-binding protein [Spirochaetales bacterium]|nr:thiamine pyrophosphate-binding protein [Spirochaetales bacterium]
MESAIISTVNRERLERAEKVSRGLAAALDSGELEERQKLTVSEALILGLCGLGVRTYIGIFGHGSTDLGDVLRVYEEAGALTVINVRNEVEASHAATALSWQYRERAAVVTSIGPGALQALAGSLVPQSNGLGVIYIFGDETTEDEGPNMQQIPKREQSLFLKMADVMGRGYSLHTPMALPTALKRANSVTSDPDGAKPFYFLLPMNVQPQEISAFNLRELPVKTGFPGRVPADEGILDRAAEMLMASKRLVIKTGGGAKNVDPDLMTELLERTGALYVHGPQVPGLVPFSHKQNMGVGGSKGSICGNFAMDNADTVLIIGARGVCQWDCSGTAFAGARRIININTQIEDLSQYNNSISIPGDASSVISIICDKIGKIRDIKGTETELWLEEGGEKKREWLDLILRRRREPVLHDPKWGRPVLTQPAAIDLAVDFADSRGAVKVFDAGDVQANGFQLCRDEHPFRTYTDTGSSYMGYAVSSLLASAIAPLRGKKTEYTIAFTGDGSFMMNPQILIDAVNFKLRGMIILFDNRRMAAISSLQRDQYGVDYATDDNVDVDYCAMARSVRGVQAFFAGYDSLSFSRTLEKAYSCNGLSVVHVPVYWGDHELGGLGAYGRWNVGPWCSSVQPLRHQNAL